MYLGGEMYDMFPRHHGSVKKCHVTLYRLNPKSEYIHSYSYFFLQISQISNMVTREAYLTNLPKFTFWNYVINIINKLI